MSGLFVPFEAAQYGRCHLPYIHTLSGRVIMRWNSAMMAPSNSVPLPVLIVVGENAFQMIVSQMFVAMKREIPEPSPYLYHHHGSRSCESSQMSATRTSKN